MEIVTPKYKLYVLFFIIIIVIKIFILEIKLNIKYNKFSYLFPKTNFKDFKLKNIFRSRELFISDGNISNEYIHFINPLKDKQCKYYKKYNIKFYEKDFVDRKEQLDYNEFAKICVNGTIIYCPEIDKSFNKPLVSIILATYNKEDTLMKSITSILNQSLKNIEIIIVDDCSTDNTKKFYKLLLKKDSRIRIFYHLKNMGVWRTRIDGLLYSRGEYVIHFDTADMYADNFVLSDAYNISKKYDLDSVKMVFIVSVNNFEKNEKVDIFSFKENFTKIAYGENVTKYNDEIFSAGHIWTRFTRRDIFIKGLYSLSDRVLNIYKNMWDDVWWNRLANINSYNLLILKRYVYLYNRDGITEGIVRTNTDMEKDKAIHEFIYFLYFDYDLLSKNDDKKSIILKLYDYNNSESMNLKFFKTKFYILDDLIKKLINDPFVFIEDKKKLKLFLKYH